MHTPVLPTETIDALQLNKEGVYVDATVGEGGHLLEMAKQGGRVIAIDWDENQLKNLKIKVENFNNIILVRGNFATIEKIVLNEGVSKVDGILFDLGLSMEQIKNSQKGFSYKNMNEQLDMRLDNTKGETAADLVNRLSIAELYELFAGFSEELSSQAIATAIYRARRKRKIVIVGDLIRAIDEGVIPGRHVVVTNVYARIFQALRIAVNDEFENIRQGIAGASTLLRKGGRLVVITFHSLEDRIVKSTIASDKSLKEIKKISGRRYGSYGFERSALLRVSEKI